MNSSGFRIHRLPQTQRSCLSSVWGWLFAVLYDFAFLLEIDLHVEYYTPVSSMCPSNESVLVIFFIFFFLSLIGCFRLNADMTATDNLVTDLLLPPKFSYTFLFEPLLGTDRNHPGCPRVTTGVGGAAGAEFAQLKHHFQR